MKQINGFGSRCFAAPEVLVGCPWSFSGDIWSLGASVTLIHSYSDCLDIRAYNFGSFI
jgi:serine/threonine protein kinase